MEVILKKEALVLMGRLFFSSPSHLLKVDFLDLLEIKNFFFNSPDQNLAQINQQLPLGFVAHLAGFAHQFGLKTIDQETLMEIYSGDWHSKHILKQLEDPLFLAINQKAGFRIDSQLDSKVVFLFADMLNPIFLVEQSSKNVFEGVYQLGPKKIKVRGLVDKWKIGLRQGDYVLAHFASLIKKASLKEAREIWRSQFSQSPLYFYYQKLKEINYDKFFDFDLTSWTRHI